MSDDFPMTMFDDFPRADKIGFPLYVFLIEEQETIGTA